MFCFVAAVGVASAAEGIDDDSVVQLAAAVGEAETDGTAAESPAQTAEKYILDKSKLTEGLSMDAPHLRSVVVRDTPNFGQRLLGKEALDEAIKAKIRKENYTFWKEQTYVGLPLIAAGLLLRSDKTLFRQNDPKTNKFRNTLLYDFKTGIDDYLQFLPLATTVVMNLAGVEGRSNFPRLLASGAFSYATMALFVNTLKYTVKEVRPDGSSANSWPSGHTATVFTAATILHKEYGLTRSPWYSVGGYAVATATGIMRVMNNRHWISDIISGAGFGILATELGYGIANLIWKDKGIRRPNLEAEQTVIEHPTFFSLGMGASFGNKSLDFTNADNGVASLTLRTGTAVQVEGAYFFNKYIGVGGRLRVRSNPIGSWDVMDSYMK
ncbi:MAG: phosphatase PAP2 family protein, partial [Bacteroidaceae bacterium]|nr:phosphatase PAP2 family protein [Bacteroidaceae bacterium]